MVGIITAMSLFLFSTAESLEVTPSTYNACLDAMKLHCNGEIGLTCVQCASHNAAALRKAGCLNDNIKTICDNGMMGRMNLTITTDVQAGGVMMVTRNQGSTYEWPAVCAPMLIAATLSQGAMMPVPE